MGVRGVPSRISFHTSKVSLKTRDLSSRLLTLDFPETSLLILDNRLPLNPFFFIKMVGTYTVSPVYRGYPTNSPSPPF